MPRWLEILLCLIAFAVPSAIVLLLGWPIVMHRAVPDDLNQDAVAILVVAVLLGGFVTMLVGSPGRTRASN